MSMRNEFFNHGTLGKARKQPSFIESFDSSRTSASLMMSLNPAVLKKSHLWSRELYQDPATPNGVPHPAWPPRSDSVMRSASMKPFRRNRGDDQGLKRQVRLVWLEDDGSCAPGFGRARLRPSRLRISHIDWPIELRVFSPHRMDGRVDRPDFAPGTRIVRPIGLALGRTRVGARFQARRPTLGGRPPRPPTEPDVPVKGIRLVTLWRCPSHDPLPCGDTLGGSMPSA
jgi:hypothetical protein